MQSLYRTSTHCVETRPQQNIESNALCQKQLFLSADGLAFRVVNLVQACTQQVADVMTLREFLTGSSSSYWNCT